MNMKLYRVTLRGMTTSVTNTAYGVSYVVAKNPDDAYNAVEQRLRAQDIGFRSDRSLKTIELLAEDVMYPDCGMILYLPE